MQTYEIEFKLANGTLIRIYPAAAKDDTAKTDQTIVIETGSWHSLAPHSRSERVHANDAPAMNEIAARLAKTHKAYTRKFWMTVLLNTAADILN